MKEEVKRPFKLIQPDMIGQFDLLRFQSPSVLGEPYTTIGGEAQEKFYI